LLPDDQLPDGQSPDDRRAARPYRNRRRALRWLVPVAAAGVVAVVASGALSADARPNLPSRSAAQLLAAIGRSKVADFSGTVVAKASLGLPELPDLGAADATSNPLSLLTGSHTIRVWYAGENKQRLALLGTLGETDVFRNGRSVWQWDSQSRTAEHTVLPAGAALPDPTRLPNITPDQAAREALALIDPSTDVRTDSAALVAGRAAYTLVLTPKSGGSRVGQVRISLDGKTTIPLAVQVYPRGSSKPAIDVSFTRFDSSTPSDDNFTWTPPSGAKVTQRQSEAGPAPSLPAGHPGVTALGSGWTTVLRVSGLPGIAALGQQDRQLAPVLGALPRVSGRWGSGWLFQSSLVTALITTDGRAYLGAVDPDALYRAAAAK